MRDPDLLPYRRGVGLVLANPAGLVFIGQRADLPGAWQMPQGGIDAGEDPATAALRELREEVGTDAAEMLGEVPGWIRYDFPSHLGGQPWRNRFRGQEQKWFALRLTGGEGSIRLDADAKPEFSSYRWVPLMAVVGLIVAFKRPVYAAVVADLAPRWRGWFPEADLGEGG